MAENEWKQKALLPKLLKEEDASYNAVVDLQKALAHENIYNIALTGPFGAGKSSVLSTLIKNANKNGNDGLHFLSMFITVKEKIAILYYLRIYVLTPIKYGMR